jgi:uncharacterized protein YuzE
LEVFYDPDVDILGVLLIPGRPARTVFMDERRTVEYSDTGAVMGVEFTQASQGVRLFGLPINVLAVAQAIRPSGVPILDLVTPSGSITVQAESSTSSALAETLALGSR